MSNEEQDTLKARHPLPDATTTLAMAWVVFTVYGFLCALASPSRLSVTGWAAAAITLAVAWSVMERKRWGRLALLGIAGLTCMDATWAALRLWRANETLAFHGLRGVLSPLTSFRAYGGIVFLSALLVLAVFTLLWLNRVSVRTQFEALKRPATRRYQIFIALTLVAMWSLGALNV